MRYEGWRYEHTSIPYAFSSSPQLNNPRPVHQLQNRIYRVNFPPFLCKIGAVRMLMMVVLEQFTEHEEVERRSVLGMVVIVIVLVAVLVAAPVDDGTVEWAHHIMDGKEQEHPPMRGKDDVKYGVGYYPHDAGRPVVAEIIQLVPSRVVAQKLGVDINGLGGQAMKNALGVHHHPKHILEKIR